MVLGESVDSALGELGEIPESGSDAADSLEGMVASITGNRWDGERDPREVLASPPPCYA